MSDQAHIGRRDFLKSSAVALGGLSALSQSSSAQQPGNPVTVHDIIEHTLNHFGGGVDRLDETIDTIKTGNADNPVHGIAVTFMATTDVIQRAIQHNVDFIITHEPTFYGHRDETDWLNDNPVYQHKRKLLDDHGITVWRYHDHIHDITPDPIIHAMIAQLGWTDHIDPADGRVCNIPDSSLKQLAQHCRKALNADRLIYVGSPDAPCARVGVLPGAWGGKNQITFIAEHNLDTVICGEVAEWETSVYAHDSQHTDKPVGLIVTGHQCSEEDGMRVLADWLKTQYPHTPVTHLPTGDAFRLT